MSKQIKTGIFKLLPISMIAVLVGSLFLFTATVRHTTTPVYAAAPAGTMTGTNMLMRGTETKAINPITVTESGGEINTTNDIFIRIPAAFGNTTWDTSDTTAVISMSGTGAVSTTVDWPVGNDSLRLNVTTNFGAGASVTVSGLSIKTTGQATVASTDLQWSVDGDTTYSSSSGVELEVDATPPTVTDGNISIAGASGTGGEYIIGDTVTVTWDSSGGGDNNADIASAAADLSGWGGGAAIGMTDTTACGGTASDNVYEACYTLVAGAIDGTNINATVTATDNAGNSTGPVSDTTNATVDNIPPTVTDSSISIAGGSGTGGAYIIGDTVTVTWNNSAGGDNNGAEFSSATANLSGWGGGAAVGMTDTTACGGTNGDDVYEACYTLGAGAIDGTNVNASVTATDTAGNTKTTADTTNATVDNIAPTVTAARVTVTGCTGTGGACKNGDTPTLNWLGDTDGETDTIASATFDGSNFKAGDTALAAADPGSPGTNDWSVGLSGAMDAQDDTGNTITVTVVDNGGNSIGPVASATGYTVDTNVPTVTAANISVTGATGTGGAFKNGDTPVPTWDVTTEGEADTLTSVAFNAGSFKAGDTALAGTLGAGVYTANLSGAMDAQDDTNNNVTVTVTDNAGNQTATAGTNNYTIDTNVPTIATPGSVALNTDTNANGIANVNDTVDYTDAVPGAADSDTFTVDFSGLTGNAAATSAGNSHTVTAGALNGAIQFTETVTDNAGNSVTGSTAPALNVYNIAAGALTSTNVQPASLITNAIGSATVTFTTASAIPANGKIRVTFGAGFNLTSVGATAGNCSSMDGTFATSVSGKTVIITRQNDGTSEPAGAQTCAIGSVKNPSAAGSTGTYAITATDSSDNPIDEDTAVTADTIVGSAACNDGIDNDGDGFIDMNDIGCSSSSDTDESNVSTGGGGGGGGGGAAVSATSNTRTSTVASTITAITGDQTYSRPVQIEASSITVNAEDETKTAQVTEDGTLTIKPNSKSTISLSIPENTEVEGTTDWDGKIQPPLITSVNTVIGSKGDSISGTKDKLMQKDVAVVISVGSKTSTLEFSNKVTIEIPVDLADGSKVNIYSSKDGDTWDLLGSGTVSNGKVVVMTGHLSYFALKTTEEVAKVAVTALFTDTVGHWAENYIKQIADLGIVSGKSEGIFAPNDQITRAELTKIAVKAYGISVDPSVNYRPFNDVALSAWYAPYTAAAKKEGIVEGYGDYFRPDDPINRAEALKILIEAAGFDTSGKITVSFSDTISGAWYMKYVNFAKNNGIVSGYGDGTFGPGKNITRAEVAKIVTKILDMLK